MRSIILLIVISLSFISCEEGKEEKLQPRSVGRFNELMLVINHKDWEGNIGKELNKVIASDVVGLPQSEPQFAITQIPQKGFKGFLKHNRNVLVVKKSKKASFSVDYNVFSKPQIFVKIKGPDQTSIIKLIQDNSDKIISLFKEHDLKMVQERLSKNIHKKKSIHFYNKQKLTLKVPLEFNKVDDVSDFVWFRKHVQHYGHNINGSFNIIAYSLPLNMPFENIKDSIISIRNSIGRKYLPGGKEGTFLITEAAYTPHYLEVQFDNKKAFKVNGKWEVFNDFMAGPFVGYYIQDKKNKRLVVVEAIVYAPAINKRDFIFELEAIIRSLEIE
ncbi:MAG TPA: DUF4837 family protein [Lutibacter sp.]|nr:DUF4837 family protein [Lutibacter sp.]